MPQNKGIQALYPMTFNQVVRGSNPRCLIRESLFICGLEEGKHSKNGVLFSFD